MQTGGIKKEEDVKKEDESMGVEVEIEVEKKKRAVEVGESSRGAALKKKKVEKPKPSKKKKKMKRNKVKNGVPEFKITITNSYLKFLVKIKIPKTQNKLKIVSIFDICFYQAIPKKFEEAYIPDESKVYMIHHSEGKGSWEVLCLVRETRTIFSSGWCRLAREYPLAAGDRCTFHLVKPDEFVLTTNKAREEITVIE